MSGLDGQLMTSRTQFVGCNSICCLNLCDYCSDAGRGGTYLRICALLISKVLLVWALPYQNSSRNSLQSSSECLKISHFYLVCFTSESSLGWLEGLFGPTPGFSCTCSLMKTVCQNFRYFKGFLVECLLWFLMLAQPQGHLSMLVLLLFALPVMLYPWCWRTSSELIPHSYLLPFQLQQ